MTFNNTRIKPDSPVDIAQHYIKTQTTPDKLYGFYGEGRCFYPPDRDLVSETAQELFADLTAMYEVECLPLDMFLRCACYNREWVQTHQKEFKRMISTLVIENRSSNNETRQVAKAIHKNWSHLSPYFPRNFKLKDKTRLKVNQLLLGLQTHVKPGPLRPLRAPVSSSLLTQLRDYLETGELPVTSTTKNLKSLFRLANHHYRFVVPLAAYCDVALAKKVHAKVMSWEFSRKQVAGFLEWARKYNANALKSRCIQAYLEMMEKELLSVDNPQLLDQDLLDILFAAFVQQKEEILNRCVGALNRRWDVDFRQVILRSDHLDLSPMGEASEKRLIAVIQAFQGIKRVTLCRLPHATSAVIQALAQNNPGLEDVTIHNCPNAIFKGLKTVCKSLHRLCIYNAAVDDDSVGGIVRFAPNLTVLELSKCPVTDCCFYILNFLKQLKTLWLRDNSQIGREPFQLGLLPETCTTICLSGCKHVTDRDLKALQETNIESVDLSRTGVTKKGMFDFVTHKPVFLIDEGSSLPPLNIDSLIFLRDWIDGHKPLHQHIQDDHYSRLCDMRDEDLIDIAKRIPEDNRIESLCLISKNITGAGVRAVVEKCPHLRKAALAECNNVDKETHAWVKERCDANRKPS